MRLACSFRRWSQAKGFHQPSSQRLDADPYEHGFVKIVALAEEDSPFATIRSGLDRSLGCG